MERTMVMRKVCGKGNGVYTTGNDTKNISSKGFFKNDRPSGTWKHYNEGALIRKEKYRRGEEGTRIKTKFYYPNGRVDKKGMAMIEYKPVDTHYYWVGKWKYYSSKGELIAIKLFQKYNPEPEILMEKGD